MTITPVVLIAAKEAENSQTTQYTATNRKAVIDDFTVHNHTAGAVTFTAHVVTSGDTAGNDNELLVKTVQPDETYKCPELVGQILAAGDFISTIAGAATSITMRASGREIT